MKISCVINCDTRGENNENSGLFNGVVNHDFLVDGVKNKMIFLKNFPETEFIVFVDKHNEVPEEAMNFLLNECNAVIIRKNTKDHAFNDRNYFSAMAMCRGDIVMHFDSDMAAFTSGKEPILEMIKMLDEWEYISYPSHWSPFAVDDPSFNYRWASTRFFMCKRRTLDFTEWMKCLEEYEYFCEKYKPSKVHPWTEHILGLISNSSVFYPPINHDKLSIFCWGKYQNGLLDKLNNMSYEELKKWLSFHPIQYPNDIYA